MTKISLNTSKLIYSYSSSRAGYFGTKHDSIALWIEICNILKQDLNQSCFVPTKHEIYQKNGNTLFK